jgi:uncharacterized protein
LHEIVFMEIAGYIAAALIGISLGLMGGGGSILTVPVLVYLFRMQPLYATSYSLFIVGCTSLTGAVSNYIKGLVNLRAVLLFGTSSFLTVFIARKWLVPLIPDVIIKTENVTLTSAVFTMLLFAALMILASLSMLRRYTRATYKIKETEKLAVTKLLLYGIGIGLVTGLLGAGGGFLLIPVLVVILKMPMKEAVGTSLLIIGINSLIGFAGDFGHFTIEWKKLLLITCIAVGGLFAGAKMAEQITTEKLKRTFGWFVLITGTLIITKEIFMH